MQGLSFDFVHGVHIDTARPGLHPGSSSEAAKEQFVDLLQTGLAQWGGHGGLRYCGIELFFKRYFGDLYFNVRYCGIILSCGMRFYILLGNGIR